MSKNTYSGVDSYAAFFIAYKAKTLTRMPIFTSDDYDDLQQELMLAYSIVKDLRVVGGGSGIMLYGRDGPCVKNVIENVSIWDASQGLVFDGWDDTNKPCYWNNASRLLIARPEINGVLFTTTPSDWNDPETFGDSPNANKLHDVRVYSLGSPMSGSGFFISSGRYNNSFLDCEANVQIFRLWYSRSGTFANYLSG